jgi:Na+-driven multidrug efflux pump
MVGLNLGAKKPERAEAAVYRTVLWGTAVLSAVGVVLVAFTEPIVGVFATDAEVLRFGTDALWIVAYGFLFYGCGIVFSRAFSGAGDTFTPTLLTFGCFWLWELPLAWVLAGPLGLGPRGAFIAITVAFSTFAVLAGLVFRRGSWKRRVI